MPKQKTRKALIKKIKITGTGKVLRRYTKQNHFNCKQTGNLKRKKRNDQRVSKTEEKNILKAII